MLQTGTILFVSFGYVSLLFVIAYYGDKRADTGRSIISNPYIYALSLAVYCTAWTFYGSVGLASRSGLTFLTIYIGPTLMAMLGWLVFRKIIRISKVHRITSIADFIASRYGKSPTLGGLVTIIAVVGVIPYIAVQIKRRCWRDNRQISPVGSHGSRQVERHTWAGCEQTDGSMA